MSDFESPFRSHAPISTNLDAYRASWNAILLHRSQADVDSLVEHMVNVLTRNHVAVKDVKVRFDGQAHYWSDEAVATFASVQLEPYRVLEGAGHLFGTHKTSSVVSNVTSTTTFSGNKVFQKDYVDAMDKMREQIVPKTTQGGAFEPHRDAEQLNCSVGGTHIAYHRALIAQGRDPDDDFERDKFRIGHFRASGPRVKPKWPPNGELCPPFAPPPSPSLLSTLPLPSESPSS